MKFNWLRIIVTVLVVGVLGWLDLALTTTSTIAVGQAAGLQLQPNDNAYIASQFGMKFFSSMHVPLWLTLLAIVGIWWTPYKRNSKQIKKWLAGFSVIALALVAADRAHAYYDKSDYAEPYFIMPNESAFWVPDVGDNKDAQIKFGSEEYFKANKIAAKRFVIPHTKLENSGLFSNYYVPAGRLIIVDRTPYSREWVDAENRGTSKHHQGFPCQSKEGLNIAVGIAIGVSVLEDNAARFLYRFGAEPPEGNRADPVIVFQSVLHSRSLTKVMDTVGRNKVQALVCNEIGSRTFDQANIEASKIMETVRGDTEKYLSGVGITLDYLGWADTMQFDDAVQKAVNDRYVAEKIGPVMPVLTQNAENRVKEGLGAGLASHGLPANLVAIPEHLLDLQSMFSAAAKK